MVQEVIKLDRNMVDTRLCYGCMFKGGYQHGCGCIIDPEGPCPDSADGKHAWEDLRYTWYEEGEPELVGRTCEMCGVRDIY